MEMDKFIKSLEEVFEVENGAIKAEDCFRDYDEWDSITLLTLTAMLDEEYGISIPRVKFEEIKTIQEMFDYISKNK
jgi:acyl carrier protein